MVKHWLSLGQWLINKSVLKLTKNPKDLKLITDFSRRKSDLQPIFIIGKCVERLTSFKFLVSEDPHEDQSNLKLLTIFYHFSTESVLTYCISVLLSSSTMAHNKPLRRVINNTRTSLDTWRTSIALAVCKGHRAFCRREHSWSYTWYICNYDHKLKKFSKQ